MRKRWHTTLLLSFHIALLFWAWGKAIEPAKNNEKPVIGYTSTCEVALWPERGEIEVSPLKEGDFEPWGEKVSVSRCDGVWGIVRRDGSCIEIGENGKAAF